MSFFSLFLAGRQGHEPRSRGFFERWRQKNSHSDETATCSKWFQHLEIMQSVEVCVSVCVCVLNQIFEKPVKLIKTIVKSIEWLF